MNYLARKIGIFFNDKSWGDDIYRTIKGSVPEAALAKISYQYRFLEFVDGSTLHIISANDNARGRKFSEVYIQEGVPKEAYECVIINCIFPYTARCSVIRNAADIATGGIDAKRYYYQTTHEAYDDIEPVEHSRELDDFISGFTVRYDTEEI